AGAVAPDRDFRSLELLKLSVGRPDRGVCVDYENVLIYEFSRNDTLPPERAADAGEWDAGVSKIMLPGLRRPVTAPVTRAIAAPGAEGGVAATVRQRDDAAVGDCGSMGDQER
ncbi:MAG: hypothetical protein J7499_14075, partial [Sphingopyxis sp.]|nr:hypothetical protein [Sphingopyxis sp.]